MLKINTWKVEPSRDQRPFPSVISPRPLSQLKADERSIGRFSPFLGSLEGISWKTFGRGRKNDTSWGQWGSDDQRDFCLFTSTHTMRINHTCHQSPLVRKDKGGIGRYEKTWIWTPSISAQPMVKRMEFETWLWVMRRTFHLLACQITDRPIILYVLSNPAGDKSLTKRWVFVRNDVL